ncbi:MAG: ParA family protein [Planctomycetota bacterium JB042]
MLTVAVINQKGGVGKTTTTVNLGAGLARLGNRVLLLDFDPQANLTSHLEPTGDPNEGTTYDLLRDRRPIAELVRETGEENLFVVPAGDDLAGVEIELASEIGRESILRDALARAEADGLAADFVLIDCAPSLGLLAVNALTAADEALVPIQAEFFALSGMAKFVEVQRLVQNRLNDRLRLAGIVICMWKGNARLSHEVREEVENVFGDVLYRGVVRQNVKLAEAPSAARTIFEYAPDSNGAADYAALTIEFLRRHEGTVPADAMERLLRSGPPPAAAPPEETEAAAETAESVEPEGRTAPVAPEGPQSSGEGGEGEEGGEPENPLQPDAPPADEGGTRPDAPTAIDPVQADGGGPGPS